MEFLLNALLFIAVLSFPEKQAKKSYCVVPTVTTSSNWTRSCSNLSFFLQNVKQFVTNETEINFMPGDHHLSSLLPVNSVTNFSMIGEANTTIWCHDTYLVITNSTSVEIRNMRFINCGIGFDRVHSKASINLRNLISFGMANTTFQNSIGYAIIGINIQGNSHFKNIKIFQDNTINGYTHGIAHLLFQELPKNLFQVAKILISECRFYNMVLQEDYRDNHNLAAIKFSFSQQKYPVQILIENTNITNITSYVGPLINVLYTSTNRNDSQVIFLNTYLTDNTNKNHSSIDISILSNKQIDSRYLSPQADMEKLPQLSFFLLNCKLQNNTSELRSILNINSPTVNHHNNISFTLHINYTKFTRNNAKETLSNFKISNYSLSALSQFVISRCSFVSNIGFGLEFNGIIHLTFDGLNRFYKNYVTASILLLFNRTIPLFMGQTVFYRNTADIIIHIYKYIWLMPNAELRFGDNTGLSSANHHKYVLYVMTDVSLHPCIFQFTKLSTSDARNKLSGSINFNKNKWYMALIFGALLNSCYWVDGCLYANTTSTPGDIYGYIMHYKYDGNLVSRTEATMCSCHNNETYDCTKDRFNPTQAGRTVSMNLKLLNSKFSTGVYVNSSRVLKNTLAPPCEFPLPQKLFEVSQKCISVSYSIISNLTGTCSLYLTTTDYFPRPVFVYYVTIQKCPLGFMFLDGKCNCDPILTRRIPYMQCNPENASILHGPNTWIGMIGNGTDYLYKPDCLAYHCSQDTFFMQLQNPDVQCLHNRTGLVCGHCPSGLDAMLGSLQCSKCSNYWLFLLPAFLVIGIILVLALFALNLTVMEGKINGFILYVNLQNTFMYKVFPVHGFAFVVVSLANLDWGIETCFYRGMTEYAKVWLRFAFPIYLFLIVLVIIYASRYSQRIEQLTRRRVIPVLATLFLLSYNKIFLVTNTALFYYIKVHKLHSNEVFRVWGLDTSVPLFGTRFLVLFVTSSLIFLLILVPANVLLLFTKLCYRSQIVINYLKPYLDAYHAPIKERHHYFLGVEFLLRAIIFILGNNLTTVNQMLAICVFLFVTFSSYICAIKPFKKKIDNIIYITFFCFVGLIAVLNVAFQFKKSTAYVLLFNLLFAVPFMMFLGILCYHAHKYILQDNKTYNECFSHASSFITQCIKSLVKKCSKSVEREHQRTPPTIEECPLQEELLDFED